MAQPRIVISGLSGGSGKTLVSLGLARAFRRQGLVVQPFKKGPDYIDAAWLALAAGRAPANLDPYFLAGDGLRRGFVQAWQREPGEHDLLPAGVERAGNGPCDLALIEGNRGLYDGRDVQGRCSTAQVAVTLDAPVVLTVNCAKMTRTAAALVAGVATFDTAVRLAGVVINNTGSARHAAQVRQAIEAYTDVPVLGALPRLRRNPLPERHMGLSLSPASAADGAANQALELLADYVSEHVDLQRILECAWNCPPLKAVPAEEVCPIEKKPCAQQPRIGYVYDDALWFYYQENLDALAAAGADLVRLSVLDPAPWPHLDGVYLGGGFPELYADQLACSPHLEEIRAIAVAGKPVYAECGGFMLLGQSLALEDATVPLAGVLPCHTRFFPRPQGLGYVEATTKAVNPFHPVGSVWRGHEFHYSRGELLNSALPFALSLSPGTGMGKRQKEKPDSPGQDGLCVHRTFGGYTHLYAPAVPHWAPNFVAAASTAVAP